MREIWDISSLVKEKGPDSFLQYGPLAPLCWCKGDIKSADLGISGFPPSKRLSPDSIEPAKQASSLGLPLLYNVCWVHDQRTAGSFMRAIMN